jgi:predicted porin
MKKHIIAAAVAAAVAVPAMAQVTVSGNVEAGYRSVNANGFTTTGVMGAMTGTPVIRFSGSEDLGGGLKANFQLDFEHNTATGLVDSDDADLGVSTVGLSGGFGSVTLGKMAFRGRDGGGLYRFFGNHGRLTGEFITTDELQSAIEYVSPAIQGFTLSYGVADAGRPGVGAASARQDSITIRGAVGPARFQYGQETVKVAQAANASAPFERKVNTFAANANLGFARVGGVFVDNKTAAAAPITTRVMGLHVAVPMGAFTVGGNYTNYKQAGDNRKTDMFALVAKYGLSKRTNVYGTYQTVNAGTQAVSLTNRLGVGTVAGSTKSGYGISVVHSF